MTRRTQHRLTASPSHEAQASAQSNLFTTSTQRTKSLKNYSKYNLAIKILLYCIMEYTDEYVHINYVSSPANASGVTEVVINHNNDRAPYALIEVISQLSIALQILIPHLFSQQRR